MNDERHRYDRLGVVALIENAEDYLIIRRSRNVVAPGKLCFPGGGIEPGETPEQAVEREIFEELGVPSRAIAELGQSVTPWNVHLRWFSLELLFDRLSPNPAEVEEILWMSLEEMLDHPDILENNLPVIEMLLKKPRDSR